VGVGPDSGEVVKFDCTPSFDQEAGQKDCNSSPAPVDVNAHAVAVATDELEAE